MYIPKLFEIKEEDKLFELIEKWSFAQLITSHNGELMISHIPVLLDKEQRKLYGHLAKPNPQAALLEKADDLQIVFNGAHCYISPSWYVSNNMVPTWNYEVVHVKGKAKLVSQDELLSIITKLSDKYENHFNSPWKIEKLNSQYLKTMMKAITGFEVEILEIKGKGKLGQNQKKEDRAGVVSGLKSQRDEMSLIVAGKMEADL